MDNPNWTIRDAMGSDVSFIYASWLNSMWCGYSSKKTGIRKTKFFSEYPKTIDAILASSSVSIACNTIEPVVIYGYIVYGDSCIYSIFTKEAFRKYGIATSLINYAKGRQSNGKNS